MKRVFQRFSSGRVILGVAALLACGAALLGQPPAATAQTAENPALLRELAERLLQPPYAGPTGEPSRIRLLPGMLPPGLPLEVPVPPGGRLIGSAVRSGQPGPPGAADAESYEIVVDAPGTADGVAAYYERTLAESGWSVPSSLGEPRPSGFQATLSTHNRLFCQNPESAFLSLTVFTLPSGSSDVRLTVNPPVPFGPCNQTGPGRAPVPPGADLIPALYAPAGTRILSSGGGSRPGPGPSVLVSEAVAESPLGVAALEAAFAEQLTAAGWTRGSGAATGPLAWSLWTVPGEGELQGFLYVLETPGESRRSLHVEVASPETLPFFGGK